jgi:predicted RNA-binding protein with TRAM domain
MEEGSVDSTPRSQREFQKGPGRFGEPVPVKEGEEDEVTIEIAGRKGDGIEEILNSIIFVPNTKAGDKVKFKITGIRGSFATTIVQ